MMVTLDKKMDKIPIDLFRFNNCLDLTYLFSSFIYNNGIENPLSIEAMELSK